MFIAGKFAADEILCQLPPHTLRIDLQARRWKSDNDPDSAITDANDNGIPIEFILLGFTPFFGNLGMRNHEEFIRIAGSHVEALNHALQDVPQERVRIHICWGNYEGPHCCDIDMDKVFPTLMNAKAQTLLFETSNPRHAHEWTVFRDRRNEIPDDKILMPGVVDTTTNFIEHPEVVAQRVERFAGIVGADRVVAGSDCGFGTFAGFGSVDPEIAYAKLAALSEGTAMASARI